jgi:hypothetical protein
MASGRRSEVSSAIQVPTVVQPTQESRGATADAAVSVVWHQEATVGGQRSHGVSATRLRAALRVTSSDRICLPMNR